MCHNPYMVDGNETVVVGYARAPENAPSHNVHDSFAVVLRIDTTTNIVNQADATAATGLVREWISDLLVGVDFSEPPDSILAHIEHHYLGNAQGSIKQAVTDASHRYRSHIQVQR
jgi:hypothetical protein